MEFHALLLFTGTAIFFSLLPGPAVLLVSAQGFRGGFAAAMAANFGIMVANTLYMLITVLGLVTLIAASGTAYTLIKAAGAAYLIYMGARTLWSAGHAEQNARAMDRPFRQGPFLQGLWTQMVNPKTMLFFGAFLPPFVDIHRPLPLQYGEMYIVTMVVECTILAGYGWIAAHGARMTGEQGLLWRDRISGTVLMIIGVLFAFHVR